MGFYRGNSLSLFRSLPMLFIFSVLIAVTAFPCNLNSISPVSADSGGGWYQDGAPVLTKKVDVPTNPNCYSGHSVSISNGSSSGSWSYKDAGCTRESGGCSGSASGSVSWTPPPAYLKPGDTVTLNLSAQASPGPCNLGNSTYVTWYADDNQVGEAATARSPQRTATWTVPEGAPGASITFEFSAHPGGGSASAVYKYVYKGSGTPPAPTQSIPEIIPEIKSGTPLLPLPPPEPSPSTPISGVDDNARFSNLWGQVEVRPDDDEDAWEPAKMSKPLGCLYHIKTAQDSGCVISFADLTTYTMKPDSEIILNTCPEKESKLQLLYGNICANIKHMLKDGTMEVELNQAVAGIKGTTFACEDNGKTSTLKVIDGEVRFTAKADGKTVNVGAGKTVTATTAGLGTVKSFNIDQEKAKWSSIGASQTSTSSSSTTTPPKKSKGCFIATAAYGSETASELDTLRAFRDRVLIQTEPGRALVNTYYTYSPPLAEFIAEHEEVRTFVREALLDPVVTVLKGTQEMWGAL